MKKSKSYFSKDKLTNRNKNYLIHDNGGRPFKVVINNTGINIYTYVSDGYVEDESKMKYNNLIYTITNFLGYWSGYDSSPHNIPKMHRNSILIQIKENEYIYVGSEIYQFETNDIILEYVSPVGNSDVPYPVAYSNEKVYFMLDNKFINHNDLENPITVKGAEDLYQEFYGQLNSIDKSHKFEIKILIRQKY